MEISKNILRKVLFFLAPVSFLMLASCGSYQYSGYESDGIYGDANRTYDRTNEQNQAASEDRNSSYYKKLFSEEAALYGDVIAEGAIFTDVEGYTSTGDYDALSAQATNYDGGNAPWGADPDSYTINIIDNGFYGGFYHPFYAFHGFYGFDPFWGPGFYGPGYWGPWDLNRFYAPYYYGHGYAYGFQVHPFFYGGYGYHNPYNFYGNRYHHYRDNIAYNVGRRNSSTSYRSNTNSYLRNATTLGDRGRSSSYSRSIQNLRNSDDNGITRRTYSRDYQTRSNVDSPYTRRSETIMRSSNTNRNSEYSRQSSNTRNSGTVRSSNSRTRSSGTIRSNSSNSGRSSGTIRSNSGSSSRGRSGNNQI